ncbi:MAG TPA: PDZ domain-containing protein, partial [Planctomycetota bacterium]|nr:PDZ domain-containing protein [Planctomycetota bacterium]
RTRKTYVDWLGLVSHEFFHTWNVKRLRPVELGPFQYESETYTRSLWVAEGITSYYTDLLVLRAGLSTPGEFLERLSKLFERLYTTPGRLVQSLEDASFDAWIKLYRPDENSVNTTVSYYVKGAIVAFLIDARIRRDTDSARSLDDVLRILWERHSGLAGFMASDITAAIAEIAGADLGDWLEPLLRSTSELDPREALDWFGLRFRPAEERSSDGREKGRAWLGITTRAENGRIVVTQVLRGSPAHDSGIDPLDELVGIGGYRIALEEWESRLDQYEAGDSVDVLVSRRERLLSIPVRLGARPTETWRLEIRPGSTPEEERRREAWWGSV